MIVVALMVRSDEALVAGINMAAPPHEGVNSFLPKDRVYFRIPLPKTWKGSVKARNLLLLLYNNLMLTVSKLKKELEYVKNKSFD